MFSFDKRFRRRLGWMAAGVSLVWTSAGCGGGSSGPVVPPQQRPPVTVPTPVPVTGDLIVTDGNSLTDGAYSTYPRMLIDDLGGTWTLRNFGVSGQTTANMLKDVQAQIDPLFSPKRASILVAWEITNDLKRDASRGDAYERFQRYCRERRAVGWKVIALTVLPRVRNESQSKFENDRSAINADMRLNWPSFADGLADVAADNRIGDFGDQLDKMYYSDGTHLTGQGYAIVADLVAAQVRRLKAPIQ